MDFAIFFACAAAIAMAGPRMVDAVEALASFSGFGRLWLGTILLAGATSLPELVATVQAAGIGDPDLAVGTVLGSNLFNMTIFASVLIIAPRAIRRDALGAATGAVAMLLGGLAFTFLLLDAPQWGRVGMGPLVLLAIYGASSYLLFAMERRRPQPVPTIIPPAIGTLRAALAWLAGSTVIVFLAAFFLPEAAEGIADTLQVSGGVIGVIGVAFATSLPEVVTSVAALRRGLDELVVGNVFGSNIFNMAVIVPAEFAYGEGSLLRAAESSQTVIAAIGVCVTGLAVLTLLRVQSSGPRRGLGAVIMAGYLAGMVAVVVLGVEA